jgi:hypothetical protein
MVIFLSDFPNSYVTQNWRLMTSIHGFFMIIMDFSWDTNDDRWINPLGEDGHQFINKDG